MSPEPALSTALADAARRGSRWAPIVETDRTTDAPALDRAASGVAAEIARHGVGRGARVGVVVRNTAPHVAGLFGIWRAGAVAVPLHPRLVGAEADGLLAHAGAAGLLEIDDRDGSARLRKLDVRASEAERGPDEPDADADAAIAYTSGTTGRPKGVRLTHHNLLSSAAAVARTRRDGPASVAAVVSPLAHVPIFVSHLLARLLTGGRVLLGGFDPERVARVVRDEGVTDLPLVPAMIGPLLASDLSATPRLAKVTVGSAVTPMEVKQALAERLPGAEILEAYGQTESTDGITMTVGREALERPGTVGRPHASFTLAVRAPDGAELGPGEIGEIVLRSSTIMRGYLDDREASAAALRDGWLHTGDLGRLDADGFLHLTGRLKEVIITGGENVSPEEVEAILARHPAVIEAIAFGTPHERWGEQVTVALVAREDVSLEELRTFAGAHLARFKLPRALLRVAELPRTSSGKVRRAELRALWERRG